LKKQTFIFGSYESKDGSPVFEERSFWNTLAAMKFTCDIEAVERKEVGICQIHHCWVKGPLNPMPTFWKPQLLNLLISRLKRY